MQKGKIDASAYSTAFRASNVDDRWRFRRVFVRLDMFWRSWRHMCSSQAIEMMKSPVLLHYLDPSQLPAHPRKSAAPPASAHRTLVPASGSLHAEGCVSG